MFFRSKSIIGLDIGSSSVKAVELETANGGYRLKGFGIAELSSEAIVQGSFMNAPAISEAIGEVCASGGFKTKDVATSVSGHSVIVKRISLPVQSSEELEETIKWEAEQYIPFDINEVNIDHQVLDDNGLDGQMDVLLVAAKKDLIHDYVSAITECGLNLAVLDVDGFAVGNMYLENYDDAGAVALVDIGASVINMNVMQGGIPVFNRDITTGGNQYTEEIQKALGISFEEAERIKVGGRPGEVSKEVIPQEVEEAMRDVSETLVGEIQRSLDFYRATASSAPLQKLVLCGGAARVPLLDRLFQEKIELPVEIADPFNQIDIAPRAGDEEVLRELAPGLSVAVGLALRRGDDK
ncbi:MAG: type IV pilus assembly protein PilM [bacterium]|nr:type IV pilus assembly protein PilM [bacterium]